MNLFPNRFWKHAMRCLRTKLKRTVVQEFKWDCHWLRMNCITGKEGGNNQQREAGSCHALLSCSHPKAFLSVCASRQPLLWGWGRWDIWLYIKTFLTFKERLSQLSFKHSASIIFVRPIFFHWHHVMEGQIFSCPFSSLLLRFEDQKKSHPSWVS